MRKEYITPSSFVMLLKVEPMMNTTSAETDGANVGNRPVGGNTPDLSNGRRGDWGNLWNRE